MAIPQTIGEPVELTLPPDQLGGTPKLRLLHPTANPEREYVSSGGFGFLNSYAATLPPYIDDITRDIDTQIYARMMSQDSQVNSAVRVHATAILSKGMSFEATVRKGEDGDQQAGEVLDFVRRNIDWLESPLLDCLYDMVLAMVYGYRISEITWKVRDVLGVPRLTLRSLDPKPNLSVGLVVDRTNTIIGGVPRDINSPIMPVLSPEDLDKYMLPREKWFIYPYQPHDGDPRGTSILRSAYHPWWVKTQLWKAYMAFLSTFAQPSVVGFTDPNADPDEDSLDAAGNQRSKEEMMLDDMQALQNGAVGAFPGGAKVQVLEAKNSGEPFERALGLVNYEITKAILGQTLMTESGTHMSRSAANTQQDVFGLLVRYGKQTLSDRFRRDVVMPLVRLNYGDDVARRFTPSCSLGETEHQDFAGYANAVAALLQSGYFDASQYEALDTLLGLPMRDHEAWMKKIAADQKMVELAVQSDPQAQGPAPAGSTGVGPDSRPAGTLQNLIASQTARQIARTTGRADAGPLKGGLT